MTESKERFYLRGGGNEIKLPSGDKALSIDFNISELENLLEFLKEDGSRFLRSRISDETDKFIRVFVKPKIKDSDTYYKYYMEVVEKRGDN